MTNLEFGMNIQQTLQDLGQAQQKPCSDQIWWYLFADSGKFVFSE
jgi:hypothetical protein